MKNGRLQRKDIPDEIIVQAIAATAPVGGWRMWSDVLHQFDQLMPGVPAAVVYAKVDRMRNVVHACVHRSYSGTQCRGDVHLARECTGC